MFRFNDTVMMRRFTVMILRGLARQTIPFQVTKEKQTSRA